MTRQQRWQQKQKTLGKCTQCGSPELVNASFCEKCWAKARIRIREIARRRTGATKRYNSVSYREKNTVEAG